MHVSTQPYINDENSESSVDNPTIAHKIKTYVKGLGPKLFEHGVGLATAA